LLLDVRVDPESLINKVQAALQKHSITDATVHPFVIGPRHSIFIGLPAETPKSKLEAAQLVVEEFVALPDRATVKPVPLPVPAEVQGKDADVK
jgi:hypothetical protein